MDSSPPSPGFAEFHRLVLEDPSLFAGLTGTAHPDAFVERVVAAGTARGCAFDGDQVRAALQAAQRAWFERHLP